MSLQASTGFKKLLLGGSAFAAIFANSQLRVYSGPQPTNGDSPDQGTFLGRYVGLNFVLNGPYISVDSVFGYSMTCQNSGTAGWCRLSQIDDVTSFPSYDFPRLDGVISADFSSNAEMKMINTALVAGIGYSLDDFLFTIPPIIS